MGVEIEEKILLIMSHFMRRDVPWRVEVEEMLGESWLII